MHPAPGASWGRNGGEHLPFCRPRRALQVFSLPPASQLGFGRPCDDGIYRSAEMHRLWEDEVCSISPGHRHIGMLTFLSRLH